MIHIVECPRDAMQGMEEFIPTDKKISYINTLLKVGFDTIDVGSFVSSKYVPQLADTAEVLDTIDLSSTQSKLSVIVANVRGAQVACEYPQIRYVGYPFSISETFQIRNTNTTIADAVENVARMKALCERNNKEFLIYLSMAFGNPYGDPWNIEVAEKWITEMNRLGVKFISLSDTVGVADQATIEYFFKNLSAEFPQIEFGAHFHTNPLTWREKVEPAYRNGCTRFDGAIKGYGGCPMAKDELVGNMPTENLIAFFDEVEEELNLDRKEFNNALVQAALVFP